MKKKLLMMAGAFIAGGAAVTGLRHYLKKKELERLASWDEDYEEDDEFDDFGFDEDLDADFDPDDAFKKEADADLLEDVVDHLLEHRLELNDRQVNNLLGAIELRNVELMAGLKRKGGINE